MNSKLIGYNQLPEDLQLAASYQMLRLVPGHVAKGQGLYEIRRVMRLLNPPVQVGDKIVLQPEIVTQVMRHLLK